jgi:hypothetical protein
MGLITFVMGLLFAATSVTSRAGKPSLAGVGFGLAVMAGAYILGIRPGLGLRIDGLQIRNPLRTVYLPWTEIDELKSLDVLVVTDKQGRQTRCYVVTGSMRSLAKVQDAELQVRNQMEASLADHRGAGTSTYGITAPAWVGLGAFIVGVIFAASGLVTGLV